MARKRKSLTFNPEVVARAEAIMRARGFDEMSDFVSTLIREEYERRHPPVIQESPAPYGQPAPAPAPSSGMKPAHQEAVDIVKRGISNKSKTQGAPRK